MPENLAYRPFVGLRATFASRKRKLEIFLGSRILKNARKNANLKKINHAK
jgi:hypothetical protein